MQMPHKFKAFISGFGGGKTWVGCTGIIAHAEVYPSINAGYFAPTYAHIRDIFYPTMEEVAESCGYIAETMYANREVKLWRGGKVRCLVKCRSMDKPGSIIGFKIGHALIDEIDVMDKKKATIAWRKIIARMRYKREGLRNGIDVTTTPEGFNFVYEQFVKAPRNNPRLASMYGLLQASTYDNAKNLPEDYISTLKESYPPQLIEAYLNGQFVNLESGSVWNCFDRKLNDTDAEMRKGEPLHVGMDFNVLKMAAVIYVIRDGLPYAVDELTGVRDTPTMAQMLKERYGEDHAITIYPDASGQNTSSKEASKSDLSILREHRFRLRVDLTNPSIKDRVNATNAMLCNGLGERRLFVNTKRCPEFTAGLEQQIYDKNGMPDKSVGVDHVTDAGTYPIVKLYPIVKPTATQTGFRL
ncbi:terminase large subunit [Cardiobacteriaceae bacterium TAE3-ERU3]|nr:terminase large subunit [Cardiobacteriaceae bacterium TAE3-ERU3]